MKTRKMNYIPLLTLILIATVLFQPASAQSKKSSSDQPETVIRSYDVSALVRPQQQYPAKSDVLPPTQLLSTSTKAIQITPSKKHGKANTAISTTESTTDVLNNLIRLLENTVAPDTWRDNGGSFGSMESFGGVLVISQTVENHKKINDLLKELHAKGPLRTIVIKGYLVNLTGDVVDNMTRTQQINYSTVKVIKERKMLTDLDPNLVLYKFHTTCFNGQTVNLASGRGITVVTDLEPLVSSNSVAFDPEIKMVHSGVILQVTPMATTDMSSASLDVHAIISDIPTGKHTQEKINLSEIDRLNFTYKQLQTTLQLPVNIPVLVGGITDGSADNKTGLYLFVEILTP